MNHHVLVRGIDGRTDPGEQLQPLRDGKAAAVAVFVQARAFHIFHYQVGLPRLGQTSIQQRGDVGMLQVRQNLTLGQEALDQVAAADSRTNQFDGDFLFVLLVGPPGQPYLAHAAPA